MDECDICGRTSNSIKKYNIEGAEVLACPSCGKHGTVIEDPNQRQQFSKKQGPGFRPTQKGGQSRDPQKRVGQYNTSRKKEKVLIEEFGKIITSARSSFGLTREELAKNLFIRETFLTKIEMEKQRPDDDLAKKIEKTLNITLLVEKSEDINVTQYSGEKPTKDTPMTLGDFARIKKKK